MGAAGGEELVQGPSGRVEKIFVSIRLRPLNEKEIARNDVSEWECINDNTIIYRNNLSVSERSMYPTAYTFDRVYRSDCSTRQVYEEAAKEVALVVVSGINASIFAYGQTSSGKTYTMSGITEYAVADIYDYMGKHNERDFLLKFSALEIYNESVRDLLSADSTPLRLLDDPERGTTVEKLTEETLRDWNHFKELLAVCEAQRQIGETFLNEASSRSHQILRLTIESSAREFLGNDKSSSLAATVNFVDLAGSERASQSLAAGTRLKEGCHINRSLLTLGTVIRKLSKGRNGHVPFRDSKLTRILQSSLGGNARTAIICTMSPARSHVEQSRNTLLFASCAKEVATNAQVNVVMSDKALVKHLQRELARLESGMRSSGPTSVTTDSAALLREKDLQIEKLKKELKEQTLQLDLAQSQVKDLLRLVGDDRPAITLADQDHHYPKLRVRTSWDSENQISETPASADSHCLDVGVRSFDASEYSDGHSRTSSDENLFHLPDLKENFLQTHTSPRLSVTIPNFVGIDQYQGATEEQTDEKSEDLCKEVRCIEMEEPITNRYRESNMSDSSPNGYINTNMLDSSPKRYLKSNMFDSSLNKYVNSNTLSPVANTATSGVTVVENGDKATQELGSPLLKEDKELSSFLPNFVVPSPEKPSPWSVEKDMPTFRCLRLTRSSSCKESLMTSLSSPWFDEVEKHVSTPPIGFEKEFIGRPEGLQMKLSTLKYEAIGDRLSRSNSQTSAGSASVNELEVQDAKSPSDENSTSRCTSTAGANEMSDLQCENQHADHVVLEIEPKPIASKKNVKDVGLDPMQDDTTSPSNWPSEFKRHQREIIELWHACNISLVHRTYFFLLFKGDPTDSIYMEVELRRLSFLKDIFSRGSQTVEDGHTLTPTSSLKALQRERQMLSKQIQKRLSKQDRQNLFLKWGIGLNAQHRRLQLVHRLWSDTKDMNHIAESASVVAKLVGSVEPGQAFKEMFGLNFTPRRSSRKSHSWKPNVKHLL
ncbi:kinesin-like protein KIN-7H [Alnus glutinosa]|uniref:kinesin-like protein KIN-7H n=1 Tax=Alnus glutinosa TaxID=3517 RepID=UPI002D78C797|nr:kinesin-like protein KIN-7H [Alnus glutinosa]XP_062143716.1 kinesin-like protein KIN-7H [Alnus glutinosa]